MSYSENPSPLQLFPQEIRDGKPVTNRLSYDTAVDDLETQ
jgi:hypothetical protein